VLKIGGSRLEKNVGTNSWSEIQELGGLAREVEGFSESCGSVLGSFDWSGCVP